MGRGAAAGLSLVDLLVVLALLALLVYVIHLDWGSLPRTPPALPGAAAPS